MIRKWKPRARSLVALAIKMAPSARKEWFAAMAAELDHVPARERWHFAAGCLLAAVTIRVASPQFVSAAARSLLIGGAMGWAALNIRFAGRMSVSDAIGLEAFGYGMALLFVTGALATARFGFRATLGLTTSLIAVLTGAAMLIGFGGGAAAPVSNIYFALIVEDIAVLVAALMVAGVAAHHASIRKAI